jgi:hypothetical protein
VKTNKQVALGSRGPGAFEVNVRSVIGATDAGVGHTHIQKLCAAMDIPCMTQTVFTRKESQLAQSIGDVANDSCKEALLQEIELSKQAGECVDDDGLFKLKIGHDMQWTKRGKGHNALGGNSTCIGHYTKSVVDYEVLSKTCKKCSYALKLGRPADTHVCPKNHTGSSKSMEAAGAVKMWKRAKDHHVKFDTYIADDDTSTLKELRAQLPHSITKWSDVVHAKRNVIGKLMSIKEKDFKTERGVLSHTQIMFLGKCFAYAVKQNKNDPEAIKLNLAAIVPHCYDDHSKCPQGESSWCGSVRDKDNYKHSTLQTHLTNPELRVKLDELFRIYMDDAVVARLAPLGSTQDNENVNGIVGSKCPKIRFYSSSTSHRNRVAASVAQKNLGRGYVIQLLNRLRIKTGGMANKLFARQQKLYVRQQMNAKTATFKKRRLSRKSDYHQKESRITKKEPTQYKTGIAAECAAYDEDISAVTGGMITNPVNTPGPVVQDGAAQFFLLDFETSRLGATAEICQIACQSAASGNTYNKYVVPSHGMSSHATAIHQLTISRNDPTQLLHCGKHVASSPLDVALGGLVGFLKAELVDTKTPIILGHNANVFDFPILVRQSSLAGSSCCSDLRDMSTHFGDTLVLMRKMKPAELSVEVDGKEKNVTKLTTVYQTLFKREFNAHDALGDVSALGEILFHSPLKLAHADILANSGLQTADVLLKRVDYLNRKLACRQSLHQHNLHAHITKCTLDKLAGRGVDWDLLQRASIVGGRPGLHELLSRVPIVRKKLIESIVNAV